MDWSAVATGTMVRAADAERDLTWLSIDMEGVVAQRNLLRKALQEIDPQHPALSEESKAYDEAAVAAGKSMGIKERVVRNWIARE